MEKLFIYAIAISLAVLLYFALDMLLRSPNLSAAIATVIAALGGIELRRHYK